MPPSAPCGRAKSITTLASALEQNHFSPDSRQWSPSCTAVVVSVPTSEPPSFSVMNCPPCVSLAMSVCVSPSRYFSFSASLPNFESSLPQPSVTLIGQPRPNSAWLNRNVKACLATTG